MSKYTTEVRYICESSAGLTESAGFNSIDDILETAAPLVFNFDFPIFDENYRLALEKKILRHYYTREICEETVGLWKLRLCDRLNMIMPYYNKLYDSELRQFNPFYDVDLTTTHEGRSDGTSRNTQTQAVVDNNSKTVAIEDTTENTRTNNRELTVDQDTSGTFDADNHSTGTLNTNDSNWNLYSDTPQGDVTGITDKTYLTNATHITDVKDHDTTERDQRDESSTGSLNRTDTEEQTVADEGTYTRDYSETDARNISRNTNDSGSFGNTDAYVRHVTGKSSGASYSKLLKDFRDTFLNIDKRVIDDLGDLFFGLWE